MIDAGGIWQGGGHHVGEVLGVEHMFIVDPLSPLCCDKAGVCCRIRSHNP